eukprot:4403015-Prorocentrum_lima.AAC.1
MSTLETGLAEVGLDMALHKTQIWLTGTEQLPPGTLFDVWAKQSRFDGVVICGEPLDAAEDRSCP